MAEKGPAKVYDALKDRIESSVRGKLNKKKFDEMFDTEENKGLMNDFIGDNEQLLMFVYQPSFDKIVCSYSVPTVAKGKACFISRVGEAKDGSITTSNVSQLLVSELNGSDALENLAALSSEVYFPLLSNPANRGGWSGPTSKEVMLDFSSYLAHMTMTIGMSRGQTLLPYPPPEAFDEDNLAEKERVHLLESSVLQWTNKIQSVLATEPEDIIRQGLHPDPYVEIEFW
jgi:dynein heavy chain